MFDSVIGQGRAPTRFGTGVIVAVVVHVAVALALIYWGAKQPAIAKRIERGVTFFAKPLAAPAVTTTPQVEEPKGGDMVAKPRPVKKPLIVATRKEFKTAEPPVTPSVTPPPADASSNAAPQGSGGSLDAGNGAGSSGGEQGSGVNGVGGEATGTGVPRGVDVLPFGEGMREPQLISGEDPQYTREALAARVEGTMLVKCVITLEGRIERCKVIKPLPHMVPAVLDALMSRRYTPVLFQGQPVAVEKLFQIKLVLPGH